MEKSDRLLSLTLRVGLLGLFLWMIRDLLTPVVLAALFALLLHPLHRKLSARLENRPRLSLILLTASTVLLGVVPIVFVVVKTVSSFNHLISTGDWSHTSERIRGYVSQVLGGEFFGFSGERVREAANDAARHVASAIAAYAGRLAQTMPAKMIDTFLFVLALYYFLRDGEALTKWMSKLSPFPAEDTVELFASIQETVKGTILGLLATAAVQGTLTTIALYAFRVPAAFVFGVIATALSFIPIIGTTPVTVGAVIYLLATNRMGAAAGMAIVAVVVGLSDNVVRPWVQSASTRMHPLVVLLGIFGGLSLFGAVGVFIGPIVAAMAIWTVDAYSHLRLKQTGRGRAST